LPSEAIRVNPECSASVRVGLGLCCYKLGQISRAQAAMTRALQLDPQNVQALVGSAILELSTASAGSQDAVRRTENAINTISMAYHVDAKNAMVLNHLANHYFWTWSPLKATLSIAQGSRSGTVRGDLKDALVAGDIIRIGSGFATAVGDEGFDGTTLHVLEEFTEPSGDNLKLFTKDYRKVVELASTAYENTSVPEIKAESCYLKARVHHATGNLSEAKLLYNEACHLWPQFPLAQYGMAQMLVNEGSIDPAMKALNAVLAEVPDNQEALVLLGVLCARNKDRLPALSKFKRALELNPRLSDAWIAQAQVLQEDPADHKLALSSYLKGLGDGGATATGTTFPEGPSDRSGSQTRQAAWTNIAVLNEHIGNAANAMTAYRHAFSEKGSGVKRTDDTVDSDALLRITDPANQLFWEWKELPAKASVVEGSRTVQTSVPIRGGLRKGTHVRVGEHYVTTAQGPEKDGKFEVADVAPGGVDDRTKYEKHLLHAANFYHEVLKKDDANAFSANGLGMVLAEKGTLDHAKDVFARVREVSAEVLGDVWINLAHVYLAQNKHNEAIRLYQNCLKKFHGGRDPSLHIYLAHAYFDARQYNDCMRVLLKALHVSPNNLQLWYNLALARETFAVAVLQKEQKGEARTLAEVENAIEDLKGATKLFSWLKDCKPDKTGGVRHLPYDASKAEKHAKFCFDNIERAAQHLNHEKMKADQQQEVHERHQRALEKMVQQRKREEEEQRRRQETHAREREERAKLKQASLDKLQESWTTQTHTELSKSGGGKGGRGREQGLNPAPQYESGSEEDADVLSDNDHDGAGQADRYGDGAGTSDAQAPLLPQPNLKDIGLSSSSDDSDDAFGGEEEREAGAGQKRKWDSDDDESAQADQTATKRQTIEDSE
ncbi:unnamed protein product, partial [Ectocarpus sp. 12 AP-2014]